MSATATREEQDDRHASPAPSRPASLSRLARVWRVGSRVGLATLGLVVGLILGVGTLLGIARFNDVPALFLLSGVAVFALVATGSGMFVTRRLAQASQRTWRLGFAAVAAAIALAGSLALLAPLGDPALPAAALPGQRFWGLPTGSRVAYVKIAAVGSPMTHNSTPIVFVHGGPGVPMMAEDARFFGQLARDGYDVYLYDQVGAGLSPRLDDPTQYTVARQVADLEAIRQRIGAERIILIGHSWGGTVAAAYLAEHTDHVAKVVFSSPGAMNWAEMGTSGMGMLGRLTSEQRWQTIQLLLPPRALLAYGLIQVNPRAAHAFAGDQEFDARFDRLYALSAPGMFCDALMPSGEAVHGLGFYANQVPQSASAPPPPDPHPALRAVRTPALVLKGSCDYLPWHMTLEYRDTLPNSQLVYLSGAGHQAYQERPELYLATVRAFLRGAPLPVQPYTGHEPPPGYSGAR